MIATMFLMASNITWKLSNTLPVAKGTSKDTKIEEKAILFVGQTTTIWMHRKRMINNNCKQ